MSNSSPLPAPGMDAPRRAESASRPSAHDIANDAAKDNPKLSAVTPSGPRKLVRPPLSARGFSGRYFPRRPDASVVLPYHTLMATHPASRETSNAESFYFQKQVQAQTLMVFVLEDGERIEGYIEWYDRNAIKVRHGSRTLIYKSSIKYLYKAGENTRTI